MKVPPDRISKFDGKTCFICGKYLLNNSVKDLAYLPVHTGKSVMAKPDKYFLYPCPNCSKVAHKRCWYNHGEKKRKKGFFGKSKWQLQCPSCGHVLSNEREAKIDWKKGYQIPSAPDEELIELHIAEIQQWKAGSFFGKIGLGISRAIDSFFRTLKLSSLNESETNAVSGAAAKVGRTLSDVAQNVFKLSITPDERKELKELRCQNCDAPLPLPEYYEEAVVCEHCGTAHLLPT
ncbi:MAG: hypothetical protein ACXABF_16345 [Candidatus Thorarchaeota archaeon]